MTRSERRGPWPSGRLSLLIGAAVLLGSAYRSGFVADDLTSTGRAPLLVPSAMTIVSGTHLLGGLALPAAHAVEAAKGIVLVDSGLRADAGPLKAQLAGPGLDWRRVHAILLTHAHGVHTGGAGDYDGDCRHDPCLSRPGRRLRDRD